MNRRLKFGAALVAAKLSLAAALSGCSALSDPAVTQTPTPTFSPETLGQQELAWQSCEQNLECAKAYAPANWLDFGEGFIEIYIARDPAAAGLPPLLLNPGGPGVGGIKWLDLSYAGIGTIELRRNYQLMAFDPRGTGYSTPVECGNPMTKKEELLYSVSPHSYGTEADLARSEQLLNAYAADCLELSPVDPALLNTQQAARDLDLWRQLLDRERLDYLGYSYGTELGATYAALFPDRVGRMVLDGAIDVTLTPEQLLLGQLDGFERAFRSYLADCLRQSSCPFTGSVDSAISQVATLLDSLDQNPMQTQSGRPLSIGSALTGVIAALYSQLSWPYLTTAFEQLQAGDGTVMLLLADFYNDRTENGYSSNLFEANLAIACADSQLSRDPAAVATLNQELAEVSPLFGRYFSNPQLGCAAWPAARGVVELDYSKPLATSPLIIGTTGDPATPYQGAVALAGTLAGAQLLTFEGEGHTAYAGNSECVDAIVDDYFTSTNSPAASTNYRCN